jgi:hypothetical protein
MSNFKVTHQKSNQQHWKDEAGNETQYSRLYPHEKMMEKYSVKLFKDAEKLNTSLQDFKKKVMCLCEEIHDQFMTDKGIDKIGKGKGNFTWYNFDGSIKVVTSISDRITFDDMGISACKELLNQFLDENIESKNHVIKEMVNDAFTTSRGKLDAKKVMNLLRYESKVKAPKFQEAMELLKDSIRRPDSKTYFRVSAKDENGKYKIIDLNFSSI